MNHEGSFSRIFANTFLLYLPSSSLSPLEDKSPSSVFIHFLPLPLRLTVVPAVVGFGFFVWCGHWVLGPGLIQLYFIKLFPYFFNILFWKLEDKNCTYWSRSLGQARVHSVQDPMWRDKKGFPLPWSWFHWRPLCSLVLDRAAAGLQGSRKLGPWSIDINTQYRTSGY